MVLDLLSSGSQAARLALVISATVDYTHNTLTISGQNFGSNPAVTLDSMAFPPQSPSSSSQVVANFPSGKAPSSFAPGNVFSNRHVQESVARHFWRGHRCELCGGARWTAGTGVGGWLRMWWVVSGGSGCRGWRHS
jgi:hypothetical protein